MCARNKLYDRVTSKNQAASCWLHASPLYSQLYSHSHDRAPGPLQWSAPLSSVDTCDGRCSAVSLSVKIGHCTLVARAQPRFVDPGSCGCSETLRHGREQHPFRHAVHQKQYAIPRRKCVHPQCIKPSAHANGVASPHMVSRGRCRTMRCLTVEETAIIQGFPQKWMLPRGSRAGIPRAPGNAIAPPVARAVMRATCGVAEPGP